MEARKSYRQFCGLARALDHIGDRWILLIVRELMLGPARYGQLQAALPGLASNLLAARLRAMQTDGIIEATGRAGGRAYRLTPHGYALEPVLLALVRWGAAYMAAGPGTDTVDERWALLALRALLDGPHTAEPHGQLRIRCGRSELSVVLDQNGRRVLEGSGPGEPRAVMTAPLPALLAAAALSASTDSLDVEGDRSFVTHALSAKGLTTGEIPAHLAEV